MPQCATPLTSSRWWFLSPYLRGGFSISVSCLSINTSLKNNPNSAKGLLLIVLVLMLLVVLLRLMLLKLLLVLVDDVWEVLSSVAAEGAGQTAARVAPVSEEPDLDTTVLDNTQCLTLLEPEASH